MFPGTTILNYLFWMAMGAIQVLLVAGARQWFMEYNKKIAWWQVGVIYCCFITFCLVVAGGFTLMGEFESHGGYYFIGFLGVPVVLVMAGLLKLFVFKKQKA